MPRICVLLPQVTRSGSTRHLAMPEWRNGDWQRRRPQGLVVWPKCNRMK
jgi:hypothetical protein